MPYRMCRKTDKRGDGMTTDTIKELLNDYVAMVQGKVNASWRAKHDYWERNGLKTSLGEPNTITVEMGRKYAKVVKVANGENWTEGEVHSFVDMENGNILKAGSWKAPQINGVRGNISADDSGASVVDEHGAKYLC